VTARCARHCRLVFHRRPCRSHLLAALQQRGSRRTLLGRLRGEGVPTTTGCFPGIIVLTCQDFKTEYWLLVGRASESLLARTFRAAQLSSIITSSALLPVTTICCSGILIRSCLQQTVVLLAVFTICCFGILIRRCLQQTGLLLAVHMWERLVANCIVHSHKATKLLHVLDTVILH